MAIQIFGTSKSFDVKKAERYFAERRIPVQKVDLKEKGISKGELESVVSLLAKKQEAEVKPSKCLQTRKTRIMLVLPILMMKINLENFSSPLFFWYNLLYETEKKLLL